MAVPTESEKGSSPERFWFVTFVGTSFWAQSGGTGGRTVTTPEITNKRVKFISCSRERSCVYWKSDTDTEAVKLMLLKAMSQSFFPSSQRSRWKGTVAPS